MFDWSQYRVLLTGASGFLGKHLTDALQSKNPRELLTPTHRDVDLTDARAVHDLFRSSSPDIVIHLAALVGGIEANRTEPSRFFRENVLMNTNIVHECIAAKVHKLVTMGSMCAYPLGGRVPFQESDYLSGELEPTNLAYATSKRSLFVHLLGARKDSGLNGIHLIPASLYGPGDDFDLRSSHVIPALIRKCLSAKATHAEAIECWGSGTPIRDFLYVEDCATAIIHACETYNSDAPLNIGSGAGISIAELLDIIRTVTGYAGEVQWDREKPDGQPRRILDCTRMQSILGYTPQVALPTGLRKTVDWYLTTCSSSGCFESSDTL